MTPCRCLACLALLQSGAVLVAVVVGGGREGVLVLSLTLVDMERSLTSSALAMYRGSESSHVLGTYT